MSTKGPSPTSIDLSFIQPLSAEQLVKLQSIADDFSPAQLAWLSGYFWGKMSAQNLPATEVETQDPASDVITVISASQTGNARRLAEQLRDSLLSEKLNVQLINAGDYEFKHIANEQFLLIIAATQGEGEPAEEAIALYKYLYSKKAPSLTKTEFAVLGLGNTSYQQFCQAGKDFDSRLNELGATRLFKRIDVDVDYQSIADSWITDITTLLKSRVPSQSEAILNSVSQGNIDQLDQTPYSKDQPLTAKLITNQKITGHKSEKDIRHIEIDIENKGLRYQAGDTIGIWFDNCDRLVNELISLLWLTGNEPVDVQGQTLSLRKALTHHYEITNNSSVLVEKYVHLNQDSDLLELIADKRALNQFAQSYPLVDMVRRFAAQPDAQQFVDILQPLTPRLYSISSSQAKNKDQVHMTVGVVRYEIEGKIRNGGASSYLADRLQQGDNVRIFIEHNNNFRLPQDSNIPIIMIGPGTGIAPFRAFMQQREHDKATGKNWLFFGNPHIKEDFLYQIEWQHYIKKGLLTHLDLAWSRDQENKIYVQDKLIQAGAEIWQWLEQGAHIYVCGDAQRMAKDVENALLEIIKKYGNYDFDSANEYLSELRVAHRYQRDVY